jgi:endoglucanase
MRRAIKVLMKRAEILVALPGDSMKLTARNPSCLASSLLSKLLALAILVAVATGAAHAQAAWVRVNQVGYESGKGPFRAYLMSKVDETGATFTVTDSQGRKVYSAAIGAPVGTWSHSKTLTYNVYALDFTVPRNEIYTIAVKGPKKADSPPFAVNTPDVLYPGLLLNTLFFYETERDGAKYIPNALRDGAGHVNDSNAVIYNTPPLDDNDDINNVPPAAPLVNAGLPNTDVSGGWWDAGDYIKYVETTSYTVALMEIGIRDFPHQMGPSANVNPVTPPASISYAGNSGKGAPDSTDFTAEARFGIDWLNKMWNQQNKTLLYQVSNSQEFNYYGYGTPTSANPNCGGTYQTPYCLFTEYDIWTLPQVQDTYQQPGDPEPCDPFTSYYICHRPAFLAGPAGSKISPNLAGRLAADFALCYQLERFDNPTRAKNCLKSAEAIFDAADLSFPDPAPTVDSGSCNTCLLTAVPFDGYPEDVWEDDMELGATELYFALQSACDDGLPTGLEHTSPEFYLKQAANFAEGYIDNVYTAGYTDTLNLYDVSGLAHYELYRAFEKAGSPKGLAITQAGIKKQFLQQVADAISQAQTDAWGYGNIWSSGDTTSHGAGLSVMASEAYDITGSKQYDTYSRQWLGNILGANPWGSSFIVGDGSTFPNCIQHQVANLAGALNGSEGGVPVLWGAATEGPNNYTTAGVVGSMNLCPANGVDTFKPFNGNDGAYDPGAKTFYQDNVQSYSTTEPAIDLTSTSFLMWSWRLAGRPAY